MRLPQRAGGRVVVGNGGLVLQPVLRGFPLQHFRQVDQPAADRATENVRDTGFGHDRRYGCLGSEMDADLGRHPGSGQCKPETFQKSAGHGFLAHRWRLA